MPGLQLDNIPQPLQADLQRYWQQYQDCADAEQQAQLALQSAPFWSQLSRCWTGSRYVAEQCVATPALLPGLLDDLQRSYSRGHYADQLRDLLQTVASEEQLHHQLRRFRQREMVRIIWRDLNRLAQMEQTTADLSQLADACIDQALAWLYADACEKWGTPYSREIAVSSGGAAETAEPQRMVVLGMGKLGAGELNLSSDIDLIFAFPEMGETQGASRCLDNPTFFNKLGQKLIQALDTLTVDGFVFRVDMRLRPYGQSGILVPSFAAIEQYYQDQGRDWERYAMIKARVVAGDKQAGAVLMQDLRPFVYRKYLDYSAFDSLRQMKAMINREVRRKGLHGNVKLGPGGIREVEFIAQAFQLIRGGRDTRLQQRELRTILGLLPETVGMPPQASEALYQAYRFLRNAEHALQAVADKQTQELPLEAAEQARVAFSMGFETWQAFMVALDLHRDCVRSQFAEVIAPADAEDESEDQQSGWASLWLGELEPELALPQLLSNGFEDPAGALRLLDNLHQSRKVKTLQQIGRERLDRVMPQLLQAVAAQQTPTRTLERTLQLIEAVLRRSAYLVLLAENPGALAQLVKLCGASAWVAEQLAKQPILLDELIDVTSLYAPPNKQALQQELRQQLLRIPEEDVEQLMEALRYFKNAHVLRVAAAEISGALALMKVSDYLTYIAEVVLEGALNIAWNLMTEKHGAPQQAPGEPCDKEFIVVGYGKVGGIELSYGSDLDLVFIHDVSANLSTDGDPALGKKPIDNQVFFTRLGQRIIHLLNTSTPSGQLYEVDMRLRPSGNAGMLVSSLKAFRDYQLKEAWTWEHQALVRARVITGSSALQEGFEAVRREVLGQRRDRDKLRTEVVDMRNKMRAHLGSKNGAKQEDAVFDLKQDRGGIVDIEFLVQYLALGHAAECPELIQYTDNIRILDAAEQAGLLPSEEAELLREAYKTYRSLGHKLSLQKLSNVISDQQLRELRELRAAVVAAWGRVVEAVPE
ncbi:MAG: bifunctional [glutamate--ammonia ligase]-adenylyl-L-tyrosine phosphorylase/[glutamate--ammonia-ligase] adenylyltransferase [Motiliproteus sp.]